MARLFTSGWELNDASGLLENWDAPLGSENGSISTTTVRSGTYSMETTSLSSGNAQGSELNIGTSDQDGPYFVRFYFRYGTLPSGDNTVFAFVSNASNPIVSIKLNSSGNIELHDEDGQIGSDSSVLSSDTWYRVEVEYDRTPSAGSHVAKARLDGSEFASSSSRNLSVGIRTVDLGGNLDLESQTQGNWFFDDFALNDDSGEFEDTYPGDGEVIHLRPNAEGDNTAWDSGTGSSPWYTEIDEVKPDDISTYIEHTFDEEIADFNLDATPSELESDNMISVVHVGHRFELNSAGSDTHKLRIKASSGGTIEESSNITADSTTWRTYKTSLPRFPQLVLYDKPGSTTDQWTKSDLDSAQIGVEAVTASDEARITAMWLMVEHVDDGKNYTREAKAALPSNDNDLATDYTKPDKIDVDSDDAVRVTLSGSGQYNIHQFKDEHTNSTDEITLTANVQSSTAPVSSTVYLQIYNHSSGAWETLDTNNAAAADTDFTLSGSKTSSLSDYYSSNIVSGRVYQDNT